MRSAERVIQETLTRLPLEPEFRGNGDTKPQFYKDEDIEVAARKIVEALRDEGYSLSVTKILP